MWLLLIGSAAAAVFEVAADGSGAYASVADAVRDARDGDTIELGPGTYSMAIDLGRHDLSLVGVDGAEATLLDADGEEFALRFSGSGTISGLTVHNLGGRGLLLEGEGEIALSDLILEDLGVESADGGGVTVVGPHVALSDSIIRDNLGRMGAGVYLMSGSLEVSGSTFEGNEAAQGGGALALAADATLRDCELAWNLSTSGNGGAIYTAGMTLALDGVVFEHNESQTGDGGALYADVYTDLSGTDTSWVANEAPAGDGGALYSKDDPEGHPLRLVDSAFVDNIAGAHGGAVLSSGEELWLDGVRFEHNVAGAGAMGGALALSEPTEVGVSWTIFHANEADVGGAVFRDGGSGAEAWAHTLFMGNRARVGGAAVWQAAAEVSVAQSLFVDHDVTVDAGVAALVGAALSLENVVIAWVGVAPAIVGDETASVALGHVGLASLEGELLGEHLSDDEATLVEAEPAFVGYPGESADPSNFVLLGSSGFRDAGDPALLDPDGSISDLGLWGGADLPEDDGDGDGAATWRDCDDTDATVSPDASEIWYDGVDSDCDGASDHDQDGDGVEAESAGGTDCDDTDPTVQSDCAGAEDTGDEPPAGTPTHSGPDCGCAQPGVGVAPWLLGLLVGLRRRRGPRHAGGVAHRVD